MQISSPPQNAITIETMATRRVQDFFDALARLDAYALAQCYAPSARFEDAAWSLQGTEAIAAMWEMICDDTRRLGADVWRLECLRIRGTRHRCKVDWRLSHRDPATGRLIHQRMESRFLLTRDGRIDFHENRFSLWRWSRQARGLSGWLLGWTPIMRQRVRHDAAQRLDRYLEGRSSLVLVDGDESMVIA